jgi:membrane protease YdiL (CAAX protease family)
MAETDLEEKKLPFNNLFLNTGAVHGFNLWWMFVLGIAASLFGYFLFQVIIQVPLVSMAISKGKTLEEITQKPELIFNPELTGINKNLLLAMLFGMFIFALLGLYLVVKKVHKKSFISIITAYQKIRFGRFFFAFFIWGLLVIISTVGAYLMNNEGVTIQFDPGNFAVLLIVLFVLMPIQTSTEEFLFRGYLLQGLSIVFKNGWVPLIITSLLFGLVHMSNPEAEAYGWQIMLPYYTLFGLFLGMLTLLDEGLELSLGIHAANNIISGLLVTSPNSVLQTDAIFLVKTEDPGSEIILWLILAAITFIIFWLKYRWKNFNLILK